MPWYQPRRPHGRTCRSTSHSKGGGSYECGVLTRRISVYSSEQLAVDQAYCGLCAAAPSNPWWRDILADMCMPQNHPLESPDVIVAKVSPPSKWRKHLSRIRLFHASLGRHRDTGNL